MVNCAGIFDSTCFFFSHYQNCGYPCGIIGGSPRDGGRIGWGRLSDICRWVHGERGRGDVDNDLSVVRGSIASKTPLRGADPGGDRKGTQNSGASGKGPASPRRRAGACGHGVLKRVRISQAHGHFRDALHWIPQGDTRFPWNVH